MIKAKRPFFLIHKQAKSAYARLLAFVLASLTLLPPMSSVASTYVVQPGDTLSDILWLKFGSPVYGRHGRLIKIIALNKNNIPDPSKLIPGELVNLGEEIPALRETKIAPEDIEVAQRHPASQIEEVAPPPVVATVPAAAVRVRRHFELTPETFFSYFGAEDKTNHSAAAVASNINYGLTGSYFQHWSDTLYVGVLFSDRHMSFNPIDLRPIAGASQSYLNFGFSLEKKLSPNSSLSSEFGAKQSPYIRGMTGGALSIDAVSTPYFKIGAKTFVLDFQFMHLTGGISGLLLLPMSQNGFRTNLGYGLRGELNSRDAWSENINADLGFFLDWQKLDSSIVKQNYMEMGAQLKLHFDSTHAPQAEETNR